MLPRCKWCCLTGKPTRGNCNKGVFGSINYNCPTTHPPKEHRTTCATQLCPAPAVVAIATADSHSKLVKYNTRCLATTDKAQETSQLASSEHAPRNFAEVFSELPSNLTLKQLLAELKTAVGIIEATKEGQGMAAAQQLSQELERCLSSVWSTVDLSAATARQVCQLLGLTDKVQVKLADNMVTAAANTLHKAACSGAYNDAKEVPAALRRLATCGQVEAEVVAACVQRLIKDRSKMTIVDWAFALRNLQGFIHLPSVIGLVDTAADCICSQNTAQLNASLELVTSRYSRKPLRLALDMQQSLSDAIQKHAAFSSGQTQAALLRGLLSILCPKAYEGPVPKQLELAALAASLSSQAGMPTNSNHASRANQQTPEESSIQAAVSTGVGSSPHNRGANKLATSASKEVASGTDGNTSNHNSSNTNIDSQSSDASRTGAMQGSLNSSSSSSSNSREVLQQATLPGTSNNHSRGLDELPPGQSTEAERTLTSSMNTEGGKAKNSADRSSNQDAKGLAITAKGRAPSLSSKNTSTGQAAAEPRVDFATKSSAGAASSRSAVDAGKPLAVTAKAAAALNPVSNQSDTSSAVRSSAIVTADAGGKPSGASAPATVPAGTGSAQQDSVPDAALQQAIKLMMKSAVFDQGKGLMQQLQQLVDPENDKRLQTVFTEILPVALRRVKDALLLSQLMRFAAANGYADAPMLSEMAYTILGGRSMAMGFNPGLTAVHIANVARAIAVAEVDDKAIFQALWRQAGRMVPHCQHGGVLADIMWAMQKSGHQDVTLEKAIKLAVMQGGLKFKPDDLSDFLWSLGSSRKLQPEDIGLASFLLGQAMEQLPSMSAEGLTNLIWFLAHQQSADSSTITMLDLAHKDHFVLVTGHLLERKDEFKPPQVTAILWSLATLRHLHEGFMTAMLPRMAHAISTKRLSASKLSSALYAYALFGVPAGLLFQAAEGTLTEDWLRSMPVLDLCRIAWAVAVANAEGQLVMRLYEAMKARAQEIRKSDMCRRQAHHTLRIWECLVPDIEASALQLKVSEKSSESALHRQVYSNLKSMGLQPRKEYQVKLWSIDIMVEYQDVQVAIEVDGPQHYTANLPPKLLGTSKIRDVCLERLGFCVVRISTYDLKDDWSAKRKSEFVQKALAAGVARHKGKE